MLTEAGVPDTDDWWLLNLATTMGAGFPRLGNLRSYREGDPLLPEGMTGNLAESTKRFLTMGRLHVADLVAQAKTSRQRPLGFRTAADNDDLGDDLAWATWKRSGMTIRVRTLFDDVAHYGRGYLLTDDGDPTAKGDDALPAIHVKSPWEVYAEVDPIRPWLTKAAIWVRYDPILGQDRITLFRPGYTRTAVKPTNVTTIRTDGKQWKPGTDWDWEGAAVASLWADDERLGNRTGVAMYEAPDGVGFYEKHTDTLDRINDGIKQRITIIAMQAFRQRAIKGELPAVYPDGHPQAGEEIDYNEVFQAGPAALWLIGADTDIWESTPVDISPILNAVQSDLKHLAAVTSTPLYVLQPDAAQGSAEGAALARETLVFSVRDLNDRADYAFAEAQALAFAATGDAQRSDPSTIETIWASISQSSITERASAASQAASGGLPQDLIDELVWELTPQQRRRAQQARSDAAFLTAPPAAPAAPAATDPAATDPAATDPAATDPAATPIPTETGAVPSGPQRSEAA